jgi:integrase
MPRPATGQVVEHVGKDRRTYRSLRFRAYGTRYTQPLGVVSREKAEKALEHVMADVERGTWTPPVPAEAPPEATRAPTFYEFSEQCWTLMKDQLAPNTQADYRWRLEVHLIPFFGDMPIDTIDYEPIERYIAAKLAEDAPLSARSINMTLTLFGAILERAVKRKLIDRNAAKDKDLRVKERAPTRSYLDSAAQIMALLDAAGELDANAPKDRRHVERRAMLATLIFAGLRIGELCALRWRDLDLAAGWLHTGSKTDAGERKVKIRGALRDELLALRGRHQDAPQSAYVFATRSGGPMSPDNFRNRVLGQPGVIVDGERKGAAGAVGRAARQLEADGLAPLPAKITPHSLRRTFCSLLYALGEDPGVVMDEMGHTDPALALRVYRQAMRRGEDEKAQLRAVVEGTDWTTAEAGTRAPVAA